MKAHPSFVLPSFPSQTIGKRPNVPGASNSCWCPATFSCSNAGISCERASSHHRPPQAEAAQPAITRAAFPRTSSSAGTTIRRPVRREAGCSMPPAMAAKTAQNPAATSPARVDS